MPGPHIVDVLDYASPSGTLASPTTDYGADLAYNYIVGTNPDATIVVVQPRDTLADVMRAIANTCQAKGNMDLLRFNGHGHPGSLLHGTLTELTAVSAQSTLSRLQPYFNAGAEAYLLNCWVGSRHGLLLSLAQAWGVPVTAGTQQQVWGDDRSTVRFEGPTRTGNPDRSVDLNRSGLPRDRNPHNNFPPVGPVPIY